MSMATSSSKNASYLPSQNPQRMQALKTFLAADEIVTINPTFSYKAPLDFLITQECIGPFEAGIDTNVPLWLALYLRKRNLCRLRCPEWMDVENLKQVLKHERDPQEDSFSKDLPFRYAEISRAILQACGAGRSAVHAGGSGVDGGEEIPQMEVVRVLLEDISMLRMGKIRDNIHFLSGVMGRSLEKPMPGISVDGMGSIELAGVKPFMEGAFADHFKIIKSGVSKGESGKTPSKRIASRIRGSRRKQVQEVDEDGLMEPTADDEDELMEPTAEEPEEEEQEGGRSLRRYR